VIAKMSVDIPRLVIEMRSVLQTSDFVPLHAPQFYGNEKIYLDECVDSTFVSSVGPYVDQFERDLAAFTGAERAVAVMNGTAALQIALHVGGVRADEEVLLPSLTFIATANAISYLGAVPHFVDSDESNLGLDPVKLREWLEEIAIEDGNFYRNRHTGRRLKALVPMHTFGHPANIEELLAVALDYGLVVIEDAAEALGSYYRGQHLGTFGTLGALSFNGNKIITTGGGGAILTNDASLADRAKHLTTTAKKPHPWEYLHDEVGYNFRMPNLNAALGCAQLEQLPEFIASKRRLFNEYRKAFDGLTGVRLLAEPPESRSNYWFQTFVLDEEYAHQRDEILAATNEAGLMTRPAWELMHRLAPYANAPRAPLPVAESLARRIINIPSSAGLA
jgi:perosamine synthetase